MSKHWWVKASFLVCALCMTANAADGMKIKMGGSIEAGTSFSQTKDGDANKSFWQWGVDNLALDMTADVTSNTKVVVSKSAAIGSSALSAMGPAAVATATTVATAQNTSTFYSPAAVASGDGRFTLAFNEIYLQHKCSDVVTTSVGWFKTPFGMENMGSRYDAPTYYYSLMYQNADNYGWNYDAGLWLNAKAAGSWDFAVIDGRTNVFTSAGGARTRTNNTPGFVFRYHYVWENGDMSLTPVFSFYGARGFKDLAFTGGVMWKSGVIWANAEFEYQSAQVTEGVDDPKDKAMGFFIEPGVDLGMFNVSAKLDWNKVEVTPAAGTSDINLGLGVSKTFSDDMRVRLLYQHTHFSSDRGLAAGNDLRLLFGTKF